MKGKIVKGIAGFYYVHTEGGRIFACKAKGIFRKDNKKPLVGDDVEFEITHEGDSEGNIIEIFDRKNELIRPAVANVDQALVIFAITNPAPSFNLLDRFLIMMERNSLPCIIAFNKLDIDDSGYFNEIMDIYSGCGYECIAISAGENINIDVVRDMLRGKTTTVAGPSGVGKSSLINILQDNTVMETGNISKKISRGKHTTRHTELIAIDDETYILDTPGFSSLSLFDVEKEELQRYYNEFGQYEKYCRFGGCAHMDEPVCGIKDAVEEGKIARVRYDNYRVLYEELKQKKRY